MTRMTIGAPKIAVTELIESSVETSVRARRSQNRQNAAPPKKHAGIITIGFAVLNSLRIRCGTATPTKLIGPANAVTHADKILESTIRRTLHSFTFMPTLAAYTSPSLNASRTLLISMTATKTIATITAENHAALIDAPEKLPCDQL